MAATTLTVNPETVVVKVNSSVDIEITLDDASSYQCVADNGNVSIGVSDSGTGKKITGTTAGTSILTITADNNPDLVKTVKVVIDKENGEAVLDLSQSALTIKENAGEQLIDVTTTADSFIVTTSPEGIVTAAEVTGESKIKITPVAVGTTTVTVTATSKSGVDTTADIAVEVKALPTLVVNPTTLNFKANKTQTLEITTNQPDFGYVIDPVDLITFDKDNKIITGVKVGTGTITIYVNKDQEDELSQVVNLTITEPDVTTLVITPSNPTITVGGTLVLNVDTNDENFTVTNSNTGVASFDKTTKTITALSVGSTNLTFKAKFGEGEELEKVIPVTVEAAPVEPVTIEVNPSELSTLIKGDSKTFEVTTNAESYDVSLTNNAVAVYDTVTNTLTSKEVGTTDVVFTGKKAGTEDKSVTVTATVIDTTLSASVTSLDVEVGKEASFNIISNVFTEATLQVDDELKISTAKNNDKILVNGLEVGNANLVITARDKVINIPVRVYSVTTLTVSAMPTVTYVSKADVIEVATNASSFTFESADPAIVRLTRVDNTIVISGQADGKTTITITAQADGGQVETVSWEITSIKETTFSQTESEKILTDSKTTVAQKIAAFANDVGDIGKFVNNMVTYNTTMDPNLEESLSDEKGAAKSYNLYILIKDALEQEDYAAFKVKFDIINMIFTNYSATAFDEFALFRYDQAWMNKWGETSLTTFQNLCTLICTLCDIKTRAANLDSIDLDSALDSKKIELTETAINNIRKYYIV